MKDILEKEIQISDLYPPTNVVRTDFSVLFARLASGFKVKVDDRTIIMSSISYDGKIAF